MKKLSSDIRFCHLLSEFIGTFFLVFIGCGSIALADQGIISNNIIPVIFGAVVCVMIYSLGHLSGAHFNPAVTLSFAILKKFSWKRVLPYITVQVIGAISASILIKLFWQHSVAQAVTQSRSIIIGVSSEFIFSFFLMFIITSVATDSRAVGEMAGIAIGLTIMLSAFIGGPLSGASMNPARSIGPAIIAANYSNLWLYTFIPILGAAAGALTYNLIKCESQTVIDQTCC